MDRERPPKKLMTHHRAARFELVGLAREYLASFEVFEIHRLGGRANYVVIEGRKKLHHLEHALWVTGIQNRRRRFDLEFSALELTWPIACPFDWL
jgi:hypothetical protein